MASNAANSVEFGVNGTETAREIFKRPLPSLTSAADFFA
jgi:hypothetical protein